MLCWDEFTDEGDKNDFDEVDVADIYEAYDVVADDDNSILIFLRFAILMLIFDVDDGNV